MAHFVLIFDYADPDLRAEARPVHLDYLERLHAAGQVVMAGPIGDGDGAMIVYRADDEAAAQALVDGDPYAERGVMRDPVLRPWKVVIPG